MADRIEKSDEQWRELLTEEQFHVTRMKGTERAFTGAFHDEKSPGTYACVCCRTQLFRSDEKYDSGSGWPSFWDAIDKTRVRFERDGSGGMERIEVLCARCDAHLGHVFDDGPAPTGQRYCINSAALDFDRG